MQLELAPQYKRVLWMRLFLVLVLAALTVFLWPREELRESHASPDGRHVVEIHLVKYRVYPSVFPPRGMDAPVVIYVKSADGRVLARWDDEMVQTAGPVEWRADGVLVGGHFHEYDVKG